MSLLLLTAPLGGHAQDRNDSTDVFFRHLELNEVIVTGLTSQTKFRDSATPMSLVPARELRQTASTNIVDAISNQPGVSQITTGSGISKPVIRGLGYNRVVVVADGVRQEGQQWGDEHGVEIDANDVGSVEILKGPASLMYGSDAIAGVLVMRQQPLLMEGERRLQLTGEHQSNNGLFGGSVNFEGRQRHTVWNIRFSDKAAHAYKNRFDRWVAGSQYAERAFSAMLGTERRWGFSRLKLSHYIQTPSIVEGERDEVTGLLVSNTNRLTTYGHTLPFQRVAHTKAVSDNMLRLKHGELKALVAYQLNNRREYEERQDVYDLRMMLHTLTFDVRYLSDDMAGWKATLGTSGMYQHSLNKGEERLVPDNHLFEAGAFGMLSREVGQWVFSGGLRFDRRHLHASAYEEDGAWRFTDFTRHFSGLTGSLGAVWHLGSHWNMRMNLSRGYRAPNISELGANGVHEGTQRYERGNHDLKPEYSLQLDYGLDFSSQYLSAQLMLFANRMDHYIYAERSLEQTSEGLPVYDFRQTKAQLLGLEALFDYHPVHRLHLYSAFSYVHAVARGVADDARHLPLTPAPRWYSEVKWELTHHGRTLNNAWMACTVDCNLRQNCIYAVNQTETPTPSYTLLHLSAGTDVLLNKRKVAELTLAVSNLTNRAYQHHLSRLKYTDWNNATQRQGVFNMGRNIVLKILVPVQL